MFCFLFITDSMSFPILSNQVCFEKKNLGMSCAPKHSYVLKAFLYVLTVQYAPGHEKYIQKHNA